jgi:hypothetical protein
MVRNSCSFTRGFSSGQSVAYQCQSATTANASKSAFAECGPRRNDASDIGGNRRFSNSREKAYDSKDRERAYSRCRRKPGRKHHCARSDGEDENGRGQGPTRADAVADISPGNLKQPIAPEKGAKHRAHGDRTEGEFFFYILSRNAQVQPIQRGHRHDGHDDAHDHPADTGGAGERPTLLELIGFLPRGNSRVQAPSHFRRSDFCR